ncbi:MAG: flavodoxin [Candidatus Moranbacteria bacterium]|nr:flavodoxin [Candidatus Moranbacteria bacterium]
MKILLAYYSRTGNTKKVADFLAKELDAEVEEIKDEDGREGIGGYLRSGKEALKKAFANIAPMRKDPARYDLVVLGTPVWVGVMSSAVRAYIRKNKNNFKKVAFFTTQGSAKEQRVFEEMKKFCGKDPACKLIVSSGEVGRNNFFAKARDFANCLKKGLEKWEIKKLNKLK